MNITIERKLLTLEDASKLLQVTERYLSEASKKDLVKSYKLGKRLYFFTDELYQFVTDHSNKEQ